MTELGYVEKPMLEWLKGMGWTYRTDKQMEAFGRRDKVPHASSGPNPTAARTRGRGPVPKPTDDELPNFQIFGRRLSVAASHHFVVDLGPLVEVAQTRPLHRRNVDEDVLAAITRLNKAIPFGRVEPFHSATRHVLLRL